MTRARRKTASPSPRASTNPRATATRGATTSTRGGTAPTTSKPDERAILKKLRAICLALPQTSETVTFGHPTFQTSKKTFCVLEEYKRELCIVFKAELPSQQALTQSPRFFTAPYIGKHGWVSMRAGGALDWGEIRDLVSESHRLVASARETKQTSAPRRRRTKASTSTRARRR